MPRQTALHKRVRATAQPTHPPSNRARSCSTNVCGQLLRQRVRATAPPMCAGNCSANVCGQLLRQRVWASAPSTCAGNCFINVRRQLLYQRVWVTAPPNCSSTWSPVAPCRGNCSANPSGKHPAVIPRLAFCRPFGAITLQSRLHLTHSC